MQEWHPEDCSIADHRMFIYSQIVESLSIGAPNRYQFAVIFRRVLQAWILLGLFFAVQSYWNLTCQFPNIVHCKSCLHLLHLPLMSQLHVCRWLFQFTKQELGTTWIGRQSITRPTQKKVWNDHAFFTVWGNNVYEKRMKEDTFSHQDDNHLNVSKSIICYVMGQLKALLCPWQSRVWNTESL